MHEKEDAIYKRNLRMHNAFIRQPPHDVAIDLIVYRYTLSPSTLRIIGISIVSLADAAPLVPVAPAAHDLIDDLDAAAAGLDLEPLAVGAAAGGARLAAVAGPQAEPRQLDVHEPLHLVAVRHL